MIAFIIVVSGLIYAVTPHSQQKQMDAKCYKSWKYCKPLESEKPKE